MNERKASEGMWLTQVSPATEYDRVFVKSLFGTANFDELYREATDEEKISWEKWLEEHPASGGV